MVGANLMSLMFSENRRTWTQTHTEGDDVKLETSDAPTSQEHPRLRDWGDLSPRPVSPGGAGPADTRFQTSCLQNWGTIKFCGAL